jgi:hypothetical protein
MNFGRSKTILLATLFALVLSVSAYADTTLYTQSYDGNGYLNASQNDTSSGGLGNFATAYDNWNINPGGIYTVNEVQFTGGYYNGNPGTITGWTVNVYFDNGSGQPGTLQHTAHISGNGNETILGGNIYTYDIAGLGFQELSGIPYWLSVVPDLPFPPQWGLATGTGGDGIGYQDYFGQRLQIGDSAFTLIGTSVPEPGTLIMMGTGVLGLAGAIRRKLF